MTAAVAAGIVSAAALPSARAAANPVFGYPHLLPSPFTLPAGRLVIGTDAAFGVTDFLQVGTSVLRDFYKIYNANLKLSMFDFDSFAVALTGGFEQFNYKDIHPSNPDLSVTSLLPGAVAAFKIAPELALFAGGNLSYTKENLRSSGIETSGYIRGALVESDVAWAYGMTPAASAPAQGKGGREAGGAARGTAAGARNRVGNVLSAGASYDLTYRLAGFGVSHHWPGLRIGVHYFPGADRNKLQPILAGGAVVDF